jgi:hypothetical protein
MKIVTACMVTISGLVLLGCGAQNHEVPPPPGLCGEVADKVICRATFRALALDPGQYAGKNIRIEGFLVVERGLFVLYSSRELYEAGVTDEVAVRLRGPAGQLERIYKDHAYSWVSIVGEFRVVPRSGTTDDLILGEIRAPLEVRPLRKIGLRREGFDEILLNLEDQ